VEQEGYFFQATAVEDPATPGPIHQAESGKKLVAVEVVIGNQADTSITVNPLSATLIDDDGFTYKAALGGRDDQIPLMDVNQGERVRGWISFKIPNAAKPKGIRYDVSALGGITLQTNVTLAPAGQTQAPLPPRTSPQLPKLGDVVSQDGYTLSASEVEDPAKPGAFSNIQKGMRLVAVEIAVGVETGAKITVNPLYAVLVDTDGFLYKAALGGRDGQIALMDLNPGERVKGWVSFQLPPNAKLEGIKYNVSGNITLETGLSK
jgi:uncharacterized protein DUF4352